MVVKKCPVCGNERIFKYPTWMTRGETTELVSWTILCTNCSRRVRIYNSKGLEHIDDIAEQEFFGLEAETSEGERREDDGIH